MRACRLALTAWCFWIGCDGVQAQICPLPGTGNPSCGGSLGSQLSPNGSTGAGNPIDVTTGNKYQREVDVELPGTLALAFVRHYNSQSARAGVLGVGWSHDYETRLSREERLAEKVHVPRIEVTQGDGRVVEFVLYGAEAAGIRRFVSQPAGLGIIEERIGEIERLRRERAEGTQRLSDDDPNVWSWIWPSGRRLEFGGRGLLNEIRESTGERLRPKFDRSRRLIAVTDALGKSLSFQYWDDAGTQLEAYGSNSAPTDRGYRGRLRQVTLPDGSMIRYGYTAQGDLSDVRYGDGSLKRYEYAQAGKRALLAKIHERDGLLAAQFDYDDAGNAIHTTHALHVDEVSLQYEWPKKPGDRGTTWVTRADGERTVYHWQTNADGAATGILEARGPGCRTCPPSNVRYEHDVKNATLAAVRLDPEGQPLDRELEVTDALGRVTHREQAVFSSGKLQEPAWSEDLEYEGVGFAPVRLRAPSVVPGKLHELVLTYNKSGRLMELEDHGWNPAGEDVSNPWAAHPVEIERRIKLSYDDQGRLTRIQGPRTDVPGATELQYDAAGRLRRVQYADASAQEVLAYDALGMPQRIAHTGLPTLELTHDALGRLLKVAEIGVEDARSVQYGYDRRGRLYEVTLADGKKVSAKYDAADRATQVDDETRGVTAALTYADEEQIERQVLRDRNGQVLRTLAYTFDAHHRLKAVRDGKNRTLAAYRYEDADESRGQPQPAQLIDPSGLETLLAYDGFGRVTGQQSPDGGMLRLQYASNGQLAQVQASNGANTRYQYDDFGWIVREVSPDRGSTRYFHDLAGNLTAKVDARGVIVRYGYDAGNRLSWIRSRDGLTHLEYTAGRLTHLSDPSGEERYVYDSHGRLTEHVRILNGHSLKTGYQYNAEGLLSRKTLPDGQALKYHYDSAGELQAVTQAHWWGETALIGPLRHKGLAEQFTARAAEGDKATPGAEERVYGNGLVSRARVDAQSGLVATLATAGVEKLDYRYDAEGRISEIDNEWLGATPKTSRSRYQYDAAGRLARAETPLGDFHYTYDSNGNRVGDSAAATPGYAYRDGSNRLARAGKADYRYDEVGNPVRAGERQYEYDADGRPTKLYVHGKLTAQYVYNSWGERIRKLDYSGSRPQVTYYLYDGYQLAAEVNEAGEVTRQYLYLDYTPLVVLVGAEPYFIHNDQLGVPHAVTDRDRKVIWRAEYTPFGEARVDQDPQHSGRAFTLNLRAPGQYADAESGTYYNYFRDYDPHLGRYLESDPIGLSGGLNTYAYARGNPMSYIDPFGLDPGKGFDFIQDAAVDALNWVYRTYPTINKEYAGSIYKGTDGKFYATVPRPGVGDNSKPTYGPGGYSQVLAYFHTHGQCTKGMNGGNDVFSPDDKFIADWHIPNQVPAFLETPGHIILRYDPDPKKNGNGPISSLQSGCACPN